MIDSKCRPALSILSSISICSGVAPERVAHVGKEDALGLIGRIGLLPRGDKLSRAQHHLIFQMVPMQIQFFTKALLFGDIFFHCYIVADQSIGLVQWCNDGKLDVFTAVLPLIVKLPLPRQALAECIPH